MPRNLGQMKPKVQQLRRASDSTWGLWLIGARKFWDWIDNRQIDKHVVSLAVLWGTWKITEWCMVYAEISDKPGIEIAAILGAVGAPYLALQAVAIKWYFEKRSCVCESVEHPPAR